jgi:hypothetical protein
MAAGLAPGTWLPEDPRSDRFVARRFSNWSVSAAQSQQGAGNMLRSPSSSLFAEMADQLGSGSSGSATPLTCLASMAGALG